MKQCSACKQLLPLDNYSLSGRSATNYKSEMKLRYASRCKPCASEYAKEWRKCNKGYKKPLPKSDTERLMISFIKARVGDAKARSIKYGRDFNITFDYVYELYTGRCAISGLETPLIKGHLDVPSLDCINPSLGYTMGNVQWVSWRVNRAKGEQSLEDFKLMCKAVLEGATTIP